MKRFLLLILSLWTLCGYAQEYHEASEFTMVGKLFEGVPNPYHRIDTSVYKGFTDYEVCELMCPTGMAVAFRTDSRSITVASEFGYVYTGPNFSSVSYSGYDLYIKDEDGQWRYAVSSAGRSRDPQNPCTVKLLSGMDGSMHECLLYLPIFTELRSCRIGVDPGSVIESAPVPFKKRIAFYGSSFTHGSGTSRPARSYPIQFERRTGLQAVSIGMSGRCMMQEYAADMLAELEADAFVFDTFSNPDAETIRARLIPFIDRMTAAHPGTPLIFQRTIYRENRNFSPAIDSAEKAKDAAVSEVFRKIQADPKYKDVYLIEPTASFNHETSVDGIHPGDHGYMIWEQSIEKPVLKILAKYRITR